MGTMLELTLLILIAAFVLIYRKNPQEGVYNYVTGNVERIYDKYAPYSFKMVREKAKELGISKITTSLVISPHKNFEKISKLGNDIAHGLEYIAIDFKKRDGFLKTNNLSKELGIYRQNYCGCEFSKR